jgi:spore coat polysaccharide biosynthesis protein SpsF
VNNYRIGIIIQARMGSTRLPGKILMKIGSKALLEHILYRLTKLRSAVTTVIATSDDLRDDVVERFCDSQAVACFRGNENNVLDRYYQCALQSGFQHIIRLTGDNPFPDIEELDNLIELHLSRSVDYTNSFTCLPLGVGAEIFTFDALKKCWEEGREPHHIEHVNEYMLENPDLFSTAVLSVSTHKNRPDVRLTVDTEDDYKRSCYIFEMCATDYVTTAQAIERAEEYALKATASC